MHPVCLLATVIAFCACVSGCNVVTSVGDLKFDESGFGGAGGSSTSVGAGGPAADPCEVAWGASWGRDGQVDVIDAAIGSDDSVYILGTVSGSIDLAGTVVQVPVDESEAHFLTRVSADGEAMWARRIDVDVVSFFGLGHVVVLEDRVVVGGTSASGTFDGQELMSAGNADILLASYNADTGALITASLTGSGSSDSLTHLASDAEDGLYLVTRSTSSLAGPDFGGGDTPRQALVRLDSELNYTAQLGLFFDEVTGQPGFGVYVDSVSATPTAVQLTGMTADVGTDLGGPLLQGPFFRAELDAKLLWQNGGAFEASLSSQANDIGMSNRVVAGTIEEDGDLGGDALTTVGDDIALGIYNATGAHLFSRRFGDSGDQAVRGVAIDPRGNVILAGYSATGAIEFGDGEITDAVHFVVQLGSDGETLCNTAFSADTLIDDFFLLQGNDGPTLVGTFAGSLNMPEANLSSASPRDLFVLRLGAN